MTDEMPHRTIEPTTPKMPSVKPSDPSRKPGFARQIANPSHHRSVFEQLAFLNDRCSHTLHPSR